MHGGINKTGIRKMDKKTKIWALSLSYILMQLTDIVTTKIALSIEWIYEANPVILKYIGFEGKMIIAILLVTICMILFHVKKLYKMAFWMLLSGIIVTMLAVINNLYWIMRCGT